MNVPLKSDYFKALETAEQSAQFSKIIIVLKRKDRDSFGFDTRESEAEISIPVIDKDVDKTLAILRQALELNIPEKCDDLDPVILIKGRNLNWSSRTVNVEPSADKIIESVRYTLMHPDNKDGLTKPALKI